MTNTKEYTDAYAKVYGWIHLTLEQEFDLEQKVTTKSDLYNDLGLDPLSCIHFANELELKIGGEINFTYEDLGQFALYDFESKSIHWLIVLILQKMNVGMPIPS